MKNLLNKLLQRTSLSVSFNVFLNGVLSKYPVIGSVLSYTPIIEGYEDANILLNTTTGDYVLKIFLKTRSQQNIADYVAILDICSDKNIPTIQLVRSVIGSLYETQYDASYFVSKFFRGKNFVDNPPTLIDMNHVTHYLARLNTIQHPFEEEYDSWGNKNLLREFDSNRHLLDHELKMILPVVNQFSRIDFSKLPKSIIHGDMQRKHVLKSQNGEYCLLDFGCMSYDARVFDISTYLAWFCLGEENINNYNEIFDYVIGGYESINKLDTNEISCLPLLINASYASYYMKTSILIKSGDDSSETKEWNRLSHLLLESLSEKLM